MTPPTDDNLTRRERQILELIYRMGEATATEVLEALPELGTNSAVRTWLRKLEEKQHLEHYQRGQTYVYRPGQPPEQAGRSALQRVLETFFGNSLEKAVAAHLGDDQVNLTPEELARLVRLIKEAKANEERS